VAKTIKLNEFYALGDLTADEVKVLWRPDILCTHCNRPFGQHNSQTCIGLRNAAEATGKPIVRYGTQKDFVNSLARAAAYIGGLGSGKTLSGIVRGLKFSQQPVPDGVFTGGPRGCIAMAAYPLLDDVILPVFFEIMEGSGLWKTGSQEKSWLSTKRKARLVANCKCKDRHTCKHEATILFRSLDRPNWMRGLELTWFFIDEGRHMTGKAWKVLWGRLRQVGYEKGGWVCSTPNGYDWMWEKFHHDSPVQVEGAKWYGASTYENAEHLPTEYVDELFKEYEGAFLLQEVFGKFIGTTEASVFFNFDVEHCVMELPYDPALELYSMWDFGVGDLNVVSFGQIDWREKQLPSGETEYVPVALLIGSLEGSDMTSSEWSRRFFKYCDERFGGRRPSMNVGDPAGKQRNLVTKTSVIDDLAQHGISITTPGRRAVDVGVRILVNMMEADRVIVDRTHAARLAAAISSHHWPVDDNGQRRGDKPVHDWSSHYCDGLRYWATIMFSVFPRRTQKPDIPPPGPGTVGYITDQIINANPEHWLGHERIDPLDTWEPGTLVVRGGRLVTSGR